MDAMTDKSVSEVRHELAGILNAAAVRGEITYITSRGRRVAAIVPVPVAEAADGDRKDRQAERE